jgi:hypothetical protein
MDALPMMRYKLHGAHALTDWLWIDPVDQL